MQRRQKQIAAPRPAQSAWHRYWRRLAPVLVVGAAAGLFYGHHQETHGPQQALDESRRGGDGQPSDGRTARAVPTPPTRMPWEATPGNTPVVDDHHIPAWKVPTPRPVAWTHPAVSQPANPITRSPPMNNPGGVNGDRPPREVPGFERVAAAP